MFMLRCQHTAVCGSWVGVCSYARKGPAQLWEGVSREHPSPPARLALTLRTVSLGVDHSSSGSEHGTAGPRDRSSHLLGRKWAAGKGAASAQVAAAWGGPPATPFSGKTGKSQP